MLINKANIYNFTDRRQCNVKTDAGRFVCTDESLFDILKANEGQNLDLIINGDMITGINGMEINTPAESEPSPVTAKTNENPSLSETEPTSAAAYSNDKIQQETGGLTKNDEFKNSSPFPLMRADEIEVRVGQVFDWGVTLLLYKDARCDQERFDTKFGPLGWQKAYQSIDGKLFCIVSVKDNETNEWISKSDVGVESNTEAEKGQASDAFKRACVVWGSGRELYSAPNITVKAADTSIKPNKKNGKLMCDDKFIVRKISYDDNRRIKELEIYSSSKRAVVFKWKK